MAFLLSLRPPAAGGDFALALDTTPTDDVSAVTADLLQASPTAIASASPVASATACVTASVDPSASASPTASASATAAPTARPPAASPVATATPEVTATPVPTATATTATATGDAVSFRFGTVQVQVTVENGVITEVVALQLPDGTASRRTSATRSSRGSRRRRSPPSRRTSTSSPAPPTPAARTPSRCSRPSIGWPRDGPRPRAGRPSPTSRRSPARSTLPVGDPERRRAERVMGTVVSLVRARWRGPRAGGGRRLRLAARGRPALQPLPTRFGGVAG